MKFLTALTSEVEIGQQADFMSLRECYTKKDHLKTSLHETNTFLVFVCFEEGDEMKNIKVAAHRIASLFNVIKEEAKSISLVPFAHLSSEALDDIKLAWSLIDKLQRVLTNMGHAVRWLAPSTANLFASKWIFFDKLESVRLGSTDASVKSTLNSLIRGYGLQRVFSVLGDILELRSKREKRKES